jgi:tRNA(Ile)-lysidine synthase
MAVPGGLSASRELVRRKVAELKPGRLVVAVSGGPDSAVAAWACARVRPTGSVRAVHIDHGWPGSPGLRRAAVAVAEHIELPLEIVDVVPASGPSPEGAARDARIAALIEASKGDRIVTGHHADDAAETVIANLLRGAGATGLSGIGAERFPLVRPFIGLRRSKLRELAEALELPFADDPSNDDLSLRRNLIRHEILPELDRKIDGDVVAVLGRTARLLAAEDVYLDEAAPPVPLVQDGDATLLAIAPLVTMPPILAGRSVRAALRRIHPPYPGTSREVDVIIAVAAGQQPRGDLSGGLIAEREDPFVAVYKPTAVVLSPAVSLRSPGEAAYGPHTIVATAAGNGVRTHLSHDWCRLALPDGDLVVRAALPGERIDIGSGSKPIAVAFGEAGIPKRKRSAWPVIESHGRIAWVAGVRIAAWARVETSATTWIELERRQA